MIGVRAGKRHERLDHVKPVEAVVRFRDLPAAREIANQTGRVVFIRQEIAIEG